MNKTTFIYNTLLGMLDTADRIIKKVEAHVAEGKATEAEVMDWKLIDDMMPFVRQIQVLTDNVKGGLSRICNVAAPKYEDNEKTIAELFARVEKTRVFVKTIDINKIGKINTCGNKIDGAAEGEDINASEIDTADEVDTMDIKLPWMPEGMSWTGKQYTEGFLLQNCYFHLITAYDIIRSKGVNIGKMDFIGNI